MPSATDTQPVCTPQQAKQLLAHLRTAYGSLRASDRVAVRTSLEQVAATRCELAGTSAAFTCHLAIPTNDSASAVL